MTGLEGEQVLPVALAVAVLVALVLGAAVGAVVRAGVLAWAAASRTRWVRVLGTTWVNVPASAVAAAALVLQQQLALLPGQASDPAAVTVVAVLGVCGGLSTYSALALELSRSLLERRHRDLGLQLAGIGTGVVAGLFGAGLAAVALLLLG